MTYTYIADYAPEGAGSMIQREVYAYLLALNDTASFVRTPFQIEYRHELDLHASHLCNSVWNLYFDFMNNSDRTVLSTLVSAHNCRNISFVESKNRIDRLPQSTWKSCLEIFRLQFNLHNKLLLDQIRSNTSSKVQIGLHIRNYSAADTQIGAQSLPWEIYSVDYRKFGIKLNNPIFYANLYTSFVVHILAEHKIHYDNVGVNIYSTGNPEDFALLLYQLKRKNISSTLFLNRPSYQDFMEMVTCDYLILAKSSFSYLASLCASSTKYIRNGFRVRLPYDVNILNDDIALAF